MVTKKIRKNPDVNQKENVSTVVYSYNVILISNKRKATAARDKNMDGYQKHHTLWKKPDPKEYILYDSIHMQF